MDRDEVPSETRQRHPRLIGFNSRNLCTLCRYARGLDVRICLLSLWPSWPTLVPSTCLGNILKSLPHSSLESRAGDATIVERVPFGFSAIRFFAASAKLDSRMVPCTAGGIRPACNWPRVRYGLLAYAACLVKVIISSEVFFT